MYLKNIFNELLLFLGISAGGTALILENTNLVAELLLKVTSLITFICYMIMNHEKISESWNKLKNKKSKE